MYIILRCRVPVRILTFNWRVFQSFDVYLDVIHQFEKYDVPHRSWNIKITAHQQADFCLINVSASMSRLHETFQRIFYEKKRHVAFLGLK
jgi:hypothetical protein